MTAIKNKYIHLTSTRWQENQIMVSALLVLFYLLPIFIFDDVTPSPTVALLISIVGLFTSLKYSIGSLNFTPTWFGGANIHFNDPFGKINKQTIKDFIKVTKHCKEIGCKNITLKSPIFTANSGEAKTFDLLTRRLNKLGIVVRISQTPPYQTWLPRAVYRIKGKPLGTKWQTIKLEFNA